MAAGEVLLSVDDLHVEIGSGNRSREVLRGVELTLEKGEMRGLVGETGSGKSMTAHAVFGTLPVGARVTGGEIRYQGQSLLTLGPREARRFRGRSISIVFQNPRTALHPLLTVETQMRNVMRAHLEIGRREQHDRALRFLELTGFENPDRVARAYPHELSGGMAQRALLAIALVCEAEILIADEPTSGLDNRIQRQVLDLLSDIQERLHLSVLMITHDLGVVAQYCDSISVMHQGRVVEAGPTRQVLRDPRAEYTRTLLDASRWQDFHVTPEVKQ